MTENSAIFNARHGGGSFHPHRQPAPTAQDCLKRGTGANGERPSSYLVNVGLEEIDEAQRPQEAGLKPFTYEKLSKWSGKCRRVTD